MELTDNIIELNRDVESYVIQASATRTEYFKQKFDDKYKPLQFVHLSDLHAIIELWNRMVEYVNHYSDYISFAIHTGDYCGSNQEHYSDCYNYGTRCKRPILNCIGNHDTYVTEKWLPNTKESARKLLFNRYGEWEVNFLECENSMTYYKDFPESNIRLIVLDLYYDIELQCEWLKEILADAKDKDLSVMTAMHEQTAEVPDTFGVTFHTINDYEALLGKRKQQPFEPIIAEFIKNGGKYICNLAGHEHNDRFGITEAGILNVVVPCATNWNGWCDGKRVKGTRTYDCFNVVSVDVNLGLLKIVRIGDNCDHYLRSKKVLCYDYVNKKVIFNA